MTDKWRECRWGAVATLEYGKGLRDYANATGPFRVYGTNGPIGRCSQPLCNRPGVIIGRKGAYRGVYYSDEPFFVIDTAFYLEPKISIDPRWAYYELLTHDINNMDSGSAIPSTSRNDFYSLPVKVPPLSEQRAIAYILGTLDDKIELSRRMNGTLEAIARATFKSWFVDFDPVYARVEGRQPFGMDVETAALFPDSFENSTLGRTPSGWKVVTLGMLAEINPRRIKKDHNYNTIKYIDISSAKVGRLESVNTYDFKDAPSRAQRLVSHGDTIWSCVRPNLRSYLFIHQPDDNIVVSTGFAVLSPKAVPPSYLYEWVTTDDFVDYLASNADGSAYPAVLPDQFSNAEMLFPSQQVLGEFERQIKPVRDRIAHNEQECWTLIALRDALLPKLMSGEIRVKDAEKLVEAMV